MRPLLGGRKARRFQAATEENRGRAGAGEAKQAEVKWAGEWAAYMHAAAAWGGRAALSCEVRIGIATGRCLLGSGCGRNKGGVAVLIPSPLTSFQVASR